MIICICTIHTDANKMNEFEKKNIKINEIENDQNPLNDQILCERDKITKGKKKYCKFRMKKKINRKKKKYTNTQTDCATIVL